MISHHCLLKMIYKIHKLEPVLKNYSMETDKFQRLQTNNNNKKWIKMIYPQY